MKINKMVKKTIKQQQKINKALKLVSTRFRLTPYDPRINTHNTWEHEAAKCKLIYDLKKQGKEVYAEIIFNNGSRCDVFVPEDYRIYEILHSETEKMALNKILKYPSECEIFLLKSNKVLKDVIK